MATLLPRGKQQFIDATGAPLVGGKVYHYIPGTTTAKDTYQDASATVFNTNPIILDGRGEAVIYGTGSYRQLVQDSLSNLIWDQLTADTSSTNNIWGGTSTGSANAQVVLAGNLSGASGQGVQFIAGFSNSGAMTVNGIPVVKDTTAGVVNLTGGEVIAGNIESVTYDATIGKFHLVSYSDPIDGSITTAKLAAGAVTSPKLALGVWTTVASAATIDLGAQTSLNLVITGTTAITSFGATAVTHGSVYRLRFAAALTLTNGANLILPTAANIVTSAGDIAEVSYDGASVWRVLNYSRADGTIVGPVAISKITATGTPTTTTYLRGDSTWSAISIAPDIIIEDQKSSGTNGGSGTGGVWNTRTLNTVVRNNVSGASLASNQITLPAGTYYCAWSAPGVVVSNHKTRLRNATTSTDIAYGTSERTDSVNNVGNRSFGSAYITFSATALVAVDHYITQSSGVGLGQSVAIAGIIETYARIEIWKVA